MAYQKYLVKIKGVNGGEDYTLPLKYISEESFSCAIHGQDLDSFTSTNGITFRTALPNVKPKCEFETINGMTQTEFWNYIMKPIRDRYVNALEKKVKALIWCAEINGYIEHEWYVPDIEPPIERIDNVAGEIYYNEIRIAFISYGGVE